MKLGLFTRLFENLSYDEMLERVFSYGIEQIELTANYGSNHINLLNPDISNIQNGLNKYGMCISAFAIHRDSHLLIGSRGKTTRHFFNGNEQEQKEYAKKVLFKAADTAKELSVPVVVGNIGSEYFGDYYDWPAKDGWEKQLEKAKKAWMPILEYYDKMNVKFAHEIGPQQLAYDLETAIMLLENFEFINSFGFCVDPSQILYTGINIPLVIETLKDKVFHFHAKDAEFNHTVNYSGVLSQGARTRIDRGYRSRIPGWGDVSWKKVLTSLKAIEYTGPISIEVDDVFMDKDEALSKSIQFLTPLLFNE